VGRLGSYVCRENAEQVHQPEIPKFDTLVLALVLGDWAAPDGEMSREGSNNWMQVCARKTLRGGYFTFGFWVNVSTEHQRNGVLERRLVKNYRASGRASAHPAA
jgi:hypothetical protein